jgi:23S rRNA A2030 N6-methylase RlmJ
MIVRISGEGQYRLADSDAERLGELENGVVAIVEGGREDGFADAFGTLLDYVRTHGTPLGDEELEGSSVILPPSDISFDEAGRDFTGEGLIPD